MNEETTQLLEQCKKAGYKFISIGIKDKRVPSSTKIEWYGDRKHKLEDGGYMRASMGEYSGGVPRKDFEGNQIGWSVRPHVVCGEPHIDGKRFQTALKDILVDHPCTAGMPSRAYF
ncbi:MAG: hypothetical protein ACYSSN_12855 [Planctomycetota bacterium]|jgi:hypothetical protein